MSPSQDRRGCSWFSRKDTRRSRLSLFFLGGKSLSFPDVQHRNVIGRQALRNPYLYLKCNVDLIIGRAHSRDTTSHYYLTRSSSHLSTLVPLLLCLSLLRTFDGLLWGLRFDDAMCHGLSLAFTRLEIWRCYLRSSPFGYMLHATTICDSGGATISK